MHKPAESDHQIELWRQRAEQELQNHSDIVTDPLMTDEKRLLHELQVHQIELELQNEALQEARSACEQALESYANLFDFAPIPYFTLAPNGVIQQTNFRGAQLLDSERSRLVGQDFAQQVSPETKSIFKGFLERVFSSDELQNTEITLQIGKTPYCVAIEAIADKSRAFSLAAVLDITERKKAEQELQLAATVYLALGEAIMVTDKDNRIVAVNDAFSRMTKYLAKEIIGQSTSVLKSKDQDQGFYQDLCETLTACGHWDGELWIRLKNGNNCLRWLSINSLFDSQGAVRRRVYMFSEITKQRKIEAKIRNQANIDPLTELPNRRLFLDRLQRAINTSHREQQPFALMFLDLDNFKDINDTYGHNIGDKLLQEAAQRLKSCIRETDTLARPGGDEFTIIIGELDEISSVDRVAHCIQNRMATPFELGDELRTVSFSIGITVYPDDSVNLDDLIKKADQAMYAAKHQGRNRFCYFTPTMQEAAESRLQLTNDLRIALVNQQFWVAYQPIVELATGNIQKAEALLRWQHPTLGLLLPAEFISIAEDTGIMFELGAWVLQQAAKQAKKWRERHNPNFQVSVNRSSMQFSKNHNDHALWFEHLKFLDLPSAAISMEINESLLLDEYPTVSEILVAYKEAGIQVALDDFGSGYSSLPYLKKFDINYLKLDQTLVHNLTGNPSDKELCAAIILMAHKLGIQVIAEGIENRAQRDLLILAGCDYGQGYFFSKPVSADEFEKLFDANNC